MSVFILHIDTSTHACSVAISKDDNELAFKIAYQADHTCVLNNMIREVLAMAEIALHQIEALSVNEGPGSFTALRIGLVTAKGICFALDKPLILIPGLKLIARSAKHKMPERDQYIAMIDARRDEVYMGVYNRQLDTVMSPAAVILQDELCSQLNISSETTVIAGNGAIKWNQFVKSCKPEFYHDEITARDMIPMAWEQYNRSDFTDIGTAIPFYLKPPNITKAKDKLISS